MSRIPLSLKRSAVWEFFIKTTENKVVCKICKKEFKYAGNTSNLRDHIVRKHPVQADSLKQNKDKEGSCTTSSPQKSLKKVQTKLDFGKKYYISEEEQVSIDNSLIKMIAVDCRPLSIVEDPGFLEYTKKLKPAYVPPSRKVLSSKLIPGRYETVQQKLIKMLDNTSYVSVTTDMWTSIRNNAYLTVTCHFIYSDADSDVLKSVILATKEIHSSHTALNLSFYLNEIFQKWNINDKITTIVTDNGANIKKAIIDHLNKRHHPCVAHTLNLCVTGAIKENAEFNETLKKCKSIVTHFKHSSFATDKLKTVQKQMGLPELTIKQDVPTRWNSTFIMIKRLLDIRQPLSAVISSLSNAPEYLTSNEWKILEDCAIILKSSDDLTIELSGEKYITMSLIIPLIRGIQSALRNITPSTACGELLRNSLIDLIGKRLGILESDKLCAKSTFLDPRCKKAAFGLDENGESAQKWLLEEASGLIYKNNMNNEQNKINQPSHETSGNNIGIWSFLDKKLNTLKRCNTNFSSSDSEMRQYLNIAYLERDKNPLDFWKEHKNVFPNLYQLYLKYMCVPATSVPSERVFSKAGEVISNRRSALTGKNVDNILFLNGNLNLIQEN